MSVLGIGDTALRPAVLVLERRLVPKPWGRASAGDWGCGAIFDECVGEIHHRLPAAEASQLTDDVLGADALLVKTLFADEMLSVQVHPDTPTARAMGMPRGKDEAWLVLDAEPSARIGLGLRAAMSGEALAAAVADGSVVDAMLWHDVRTGDVLMVPAGTVHAIGAGVTLLEIQENNDLTWRLFDHERGRKLNVEQGLAVARRDAWARPASLPSPGPGRDLLCAGGGFVMERVVGRGLLQPETGRPAWVAALGEGVRIGGLAVPKGAVALVSEAVPMMAGPDGLGGVLLSQAGSTAQPGLWQPA